MMSAVARFAGIRYADAASGLRMPRTLFLLVTATLALFCANNAAGSPITSALIAAKWIPLLGLCLAAPAMIRKLRTPSLPIITIVPLATLTGVALLSSLM